MGNDTSLTIVVLAGGDSAERDVSLVSGRCVQRALEEAGYRVRRVDPALQPLENVDWSDVDACFIALHGGAGEDGRVQQALLEGGVPYTGSGPAASRLAMSKSAAKERFLQAGVPTPDYVLLNQADSPQVAAGKVAPLGFPLVVKPEGQGSSLGVSIVPSAEDLGRAVAAAHRFDPFAIAETYVAGRELTVSVLGRRPLDVLEIVPPDGLFDYEAKYRAPATEYRFKTGLSPEHLAYVAQTAVAAAAALGTAGLVRVDLLLDEVGLPWVLEVNTVPGLTDRSMAPMAAARAGLSMPRLCDWMIREGLRQQVAA